MKSFVPAALALGLLTTVARAANPVVVMETSLGTVKIELFEDKAPVTVKNFLAYVEEKHYDNTLFHRVVDNFVVQGGGYDLEKAEKKTKPPIKNESDNGLKNDRGTVAMARTLDPDSATAQFFINVQNNPDLDRGKYADGIGHCVFGKVTEGLDVVDKIKAAKTGQAMLGGKSGKPHQNVPTENVVIKSIRVAEVKKD